MIADAFLETTFITSVSKGGTERPGLPFPFFSSWGSFLGVPIIGRTAVLWLQKGNPLTGSRNTPKPENLNIPKLKTTLNPKP